MLPNGCSDGDDTAPYWPYTLVVLRLDLRASEQLFERERRRGCQTVFDSAWVDTADGRPELCSFNDRIDN